MENRILTWNILMLWMLVGSFICNADKLSQDQKPPTYAMYSGGTALKTPLIGKRAAADVGSRPDVGRSNSGGASTQPKSQLPTPTNEEVIREETEDLKIVDGKPVRVVKGRLAYSSPEGLPIAVKYEADEMGNRASFTIGTAVGVGGGSGSRSSSSSSSLGGKSGNSKGGGNASDSDASNKSKSSTYLPPMNENNNPNSNKSNKSYLPPSS